MSTVNVRRLVENIRSGANVYTPLVELVVNAIQAIDAKGIPNGTYGRAAFQFCANLSRSRTS